MSHRDGRWTSTPYAIAAALWLALQALPARATAGGRDACGHAESTAAMRVCENDRLRKAEAELAATYAALERQAKGRRRALLRDAQRAWRRYREAEVAFQGSAAGGGTLAPLLEASARADLTEDRTAALRRTIDIR